MVVFRGRTTESARRSAVCWWLKRTTLCEAGNFIENFQKALKLDNSTARRKFATTKIKRLRGSLARLTSSAARIEVHVLE